MKKISLIFAVFLAFALLLGVGIRGAQAHGNLLGALKVGGGWVSVVSYVNTMPGAPAVFVHATYEVKDPTNLTAACTHLDGVSATTENDLTTTVLNVTGGGVGTVFPAGDTVGSALIAPPTLATPTTEGFLVLENYDSAGALGADGTLSSEAIIFNLASGFLYSQRALTVSQTAINTVNIEAPLCGNCNYLQATPFSAGGATAFGNVTVGTLSRFMFLPPATATTGAYVIALNRPGTAEFADSATTTNLAASGYNARIRLEARRDVAQGYALGVYNRLEDYRSITAGNEIICLAQLTASQLIGGGISAFIADGGWENLSPRCRETEDGGLTYIVCDGDGLGTEVGDAAIIYKVEYASGYGYAVTPQHQQWYVK